MRIALFGGSFDPPHLGHVLAATWAMSVANVDEVWVLPVARHAYDKPLSPWAQRFELCQAAFTPLGFARVRDDELQNPMGYTFSLVERLRRSHPEHAWFLVGGTDTFQDLANWHRGSELTGLVTVIAVPRSGYDAGHPSALPAISSSMIRTLLGAGKPVTSLLPGAVEEMIRERGWYGPRASRP